MGQLKEHFWFSSPNGLNAWIIVDGNVAAKALKGDWDIKQVGWHREWPCEGQQIEARPVLLKWRHKQ